MSAHTSRKHGAQRVGDVRAVQVRGHRLVPNWSPRGVSVTRTSKAHRRVKRLARQGLSRHDTWQPCAELADGVPALPGITAAPLLLIDQLTSRGEPTGASQQLREGPSRSEIDRAMCHREPGGQAAERAGLDRRAAGPRRADRQEARLPPKRSARLVCVAGCASSPSRTRPPTTTTAARIRTAHGRPSA